MVARMRTNLLLFLLKYIEIDTSTIHNEKKTESGKNDSFLAEKRVDCLNVNIIQLETKTRANIKS